jgi:hypothetical protein
MIPAGAAAVKSGKSVIIQSWDKIYSINYFEYSIDLKYINSCLRTI